MIIYNSHKSSNSHRYQLFNSISTIMLAVLNRQSNTELVNKMVRILTKFMMN